jgi:uncharacterized protein (DUF362 family)
MNLAAHPTLNVVDATTCMIAGGPVGGTAATANVIMASGDRVAADVVGLALISHFGQWEKVTSQGVWEQRQVRHALALGVGLADPSSLAVVTRSLPGDSADFHRVLDTVHRLVGVSPVPS